MRVLADCIRLEMKDEKLLSAIDSRAKLQEKTPPIQKVRNSMIDFEDLMEDTSSTTAPLHFSWSDLDSSQGSEVTRSEVNAQVPNGVENVQYFLQCKLRLYLRRELIAIYAIVHVLCMPVWRIHRCNLGVLLHISRVLQ